MEPMHPPPRRVEKPVLLAVLVAAVAATACRKDEITHYRVEKSKAPAVPAGMMAGPGPGPAPIAGGGMQGDVPPPAAPSGDAAIAWTLPKGWTESRGGGGMRYATLKPGGSAAEVSVIVLPGSAGGELANVNRWRNQIGLAPIDDAGLSGARQVVKTPAAPVAVYDFTSDAGKRVVGGLAEVQGNTWFFKLSGDSASVASAKPDFLRLLGSLHR